MTKAQDVNHDQCVAGMKQLEKLLKEGREELEEYRQRELETNRLLIRYLVQERNLLAERINESSTE
jgi:hypothetical protein